jgi:hypothetical protein
MPRVILDAAELAQMLQLLSCAAFWSGGCQPIVSVNDARWPTGSGASLTRRRLCGEVATWPCLRTTGRTCGPGASG